MKTNFKYDFVNKTIIASKTALRLASDPATKEFAELMEMVKCHPDFKVVERKIKKSQGKTTYKGLTILTMKNYIGRDAGKLAELDKALNMGGYPLAKQWFLDTYEKPTMENIRKQASKNKVRKVCVKQIMEAATPDAYGQVCQLPIAANQ